jgi:hydroxymethylglutaryl-CoA lyase
MTQTSVTLVEVGPRDGFQAIEPWIPTETKRALIEGARRAGLRAIETGSFVSDRAVPQLKDSPELLAHCNSLEGVAPRVLVPNARQAERALESGARRLVFVFSVSETHNLKNVRRSVTQSIEEYRQVVSLLAPNIGLRLDLATSFDCPYEGRLAEDQVLRTLEAVVGVREEIELALCDTTGRADPGHVQLLFATARERYPQIERWAFHGHDTYGMGVANVKAAWDCGVTIFDAAFGGLGGCPFAPGAAGNVATEDLVWMFDRMGVSTGVDLDALLDVARRAAALPGGQPGGRVRTAISGRSRGCPVPREEDEVS